MPGATSMLIWLVVLVVFTIIFGPNLQRHFVRALDPVFINDDVRQQIFPFFRFEDARLFHDDYVGNYYFDILPILYRSIYVVAACFGETVTLSKLLPYLLLFIVVIAMAFAAHRLSGKVGAVTAMTLILGHSMYLARLCGGLPRSFAFPVIALLVLTLATGHVYGLAALTCIAAGFYPVVALICGSCLVGWLILLPARARGQAANWSFKRRVSVLFLTACGALLFLFPQSLGTKKYGGIIAVTRLAEFPEIGPYGRYASEDRAPFLGLFEAVRSAVDRSLFGSGDPLSESFRDWVTNTSGMNAKELTEGLVLAAVAIWFFRIFHSKELPRIALLPVCVAVGYWLSCRYAPHLFLPQRYVVYTVPLITVLLISTAAGLAAASFTRLKPGMRQLTAALVCVPLLLLAGGRGTKDSGLATVLRPNDALMQAVGKLPPDALVAAWPNGIANDIPYVARRRIFVSNEIHQAFHLAYTLEMRKRVFALIDAYSATTVEPLVHLYREFGVTHLIVQGEYVGGKTPRYFRPFDAAINDAAWRLNDQVPITQRLMDSAFVFRRGNVAILSLAKVAGGS
jgi:hypothetical protein